MTLANWSILIACLLPSATIALSKAATYALPQDAGGYDNHNPRLWAASLHGWPQRAHAAQLNGFEALPLFIAAVILAQQAHADQGLVDMLALSFIGLRLVYIACYIADWALLRSIVWFAATLCCIVILLQS